MQISHKDQIGLALQAPYAEGPNMLGYLIQKDVSNFYCEYNILIPHCSNLCNDCGANSNGGGNVVIN